MQQERNIKEKSVLKSKEECLGIITKIFISNSIHSEITFLAKCLPKLFLLFRFFFCSLTLHSVNH